MGIGQRQIDQFFTKKLKNDQNDNQTSDKSESPVELAQSIDLTMTESDVRTLLNQGCRARFLDSATLIVRT